MMLPVLPFSFIEGNASTAPAASNALNAWSIPASDAPNCCQSNGIPSANFKPIRFAVSRNICSLIGFVAVELTYVRSNSGRVIVSPSITTSMVIWTGLKMPVTILYISPVLGDFCSITLMRDKVALCNVAYAASTGVPLMLALNATRRPM